MSLVDLYLIPLWKYWKKKHHQNSTAPHLIVSFFLEPLKTMCLAGSNLSEDEPFGSDPTLESPEDYYVPDFDELAKYANDDEVRMRVKQWKELLIGGSTSLELKFWFEKVKKRYGPQITGHEECFRAYPLFTSENFSSVFSGTIESCEECFHKWVQLQWSQKGEKSILPSFPCRIKAVTGFIPSWFV